MLIATYVNSSTIRLCTVYSIHVYTYTQMTRLEMWRQAEKVGNEVL